MPREIPVEEHWHPLIKKLVSRFNKYVRKHSLYNIGEYLEKLIDVMDKDPDEPGVHAAEALALIRTLNPHLITSYTSERIDKTLMRAGGSGAPYYSDPDEIYRKTESTVNPNESIFYKSTDSQISSIFDYGAVNETDYNITDNHNNNGADWIIPSEGYNPEELEIYNPEEDEAEENDTELLMMKSVEELGIKNVKEVPMREEYAKRKCAMGDGEFGDYSGKIYECKCGTLYHETCLKVQAIYVGKCHICDAEFFDEKDSDNGNA